MQLAIRDACVADELRRVAPACCGALRRLGTKLVEKDVAAALDDFADRVTATRNAVAHAKANYQSTGFEVPERERADFVVACRLAAEQAIRWFARSDPALRTLTHA